MLIKHSLPILSSADSLSRKSTTNTTAPYFMKANYEIHINPKKNFLKVETMLVEYISREAYDKLLLVDDGDE